MTQAPKRIRVVTNSKGFISLDTDRGQWSIDQWNKEFAHTSPHTEHFYTLEEKMTQEEPKTMTARERANKSQRKYYLANKAKCDKAKRKWNAENPEKRIAHQAVNRAIQSNKLKRGVCEECGSEKTEAHHDDYNKPLEVRWLCKKHHIEKHYVRKGER